MAPWAHKALSKTAASAGKATANRHLARGRRALPAVRADCAFLPLLKLERIFFLVVCPECRLTPASSLVVIVALAPRHGSFVLKNRCESIALLVVFIGQGKRQVRILLRCHLNNKYYC